ncbi:hypothetical protein [Candidatus Litorirhabdus singularis]|uniref:hypothetical protein n=1 Tax=Candidatus Litorirhabdus singularis TaxID=2518993 RepID=UPI002430E0E0|nr:hypothetical protein [Candidatus Litorirhabdus singularis]
MNFENYLQDAIAMIDSWEVADSDFANAVNDQARLMAGLGLEPTEQTDFDISIPSPHQ